MNELLPKIKQLVKGGFLHILTGNFLCRAISMISSIVVARIVDKTEYAYISYADNIYTYVGLVTGLGMSAALLKFCSLRNTEAKNRGYLQYAAVKGSGVQLLISLVVCVACMFIDIPFPNARKYIWALALYQPLYFVYDSFSAYIRVKRENRRYASAGIIMSSVLCVFSIVLLILVGTMGLIYARYIAVTIVLLYFWVYVRKCFTGVEYEPISKEEKKALLSMGLSLMAARMFSEMMPANETFLVNAIIKDEVITANFRIAGVFPQLLLLVASAVSLYFFPIVADMTDWSKIRKRMIQLGMFNFGFVLFAALVGALLTPLAIKILYGQKYADAIPMTYMLWIMNAMNGCIRMFPMNMLPALGKTKFNMYMAAGSCVVQTIMDYFFISKLGVYGIAWGTTVVYALSGGAYWWYLMKECKDEEKKQQAAL